MALVKTCRYCHEGIELIEQGWIAVEEDSYYDLWCPNSAVGLHYPFVREDAVIAIGWIYWELRE